MKRILTLLIVIVSFGMGYAFRKVTAPAAPTQHRKVTGIGGVFFKSHDSKKLKEWYAKNLGLNMGPYGTLFEWRQARDSSKKGGTQWSTFSERTTYFAPSTKDFMINYRVENLEELVAELRKDGVVIVDSMQTVDYGKFIHIMDLENNKIELWEPIETDNKTGDIGITK